MHRPLCPVKIPFNTGQHICHRFIHIYGKQMWHINMCGKHLHLRGDSFKNMQTARLCRMIMLVESGNKTTAFCWEEWGMLNTTMQPTHFLFPPYLRKNSSVFCFFFMPLMFNMCSLRCCKFISVTLMMLCKWERVIYPVFTGKDKRPFRHYFIAH